METSAGRRGKNEINRAGQDGGAGHGQGDTVITAKRQAVNRKNQGEAQKSTVFYTLNIDLT